MQVPWLYWDVLWMKEFDDGDYDDDNFLSHAATLLINYSYIFVYLFYTHYFNIFLNDTFEVHRNNSFFFFLVDDCVVGGVCVRRRS